MNLIDSKELFVSDNLKSFHFKVVFSATNAFKNQGKDFNELVALFIH